MWWMCWEKIGHKREILNMKIPFYRGKMRREITKPAARENCFVFPLGLLARCHKMPKV
jgi:hypothetical protein